MTANSAWPHPHLFRPRRTGATPLCSGLPWREHTSHRSSASTARLLSNSTAAPEPLWVTKRYPAVPRPAYSMDLMGFVMWVHSDTCKAAAGALVMHAKEPSPGQGLR